MGYKYFDISRLLSQETPVWPGAENFVHKINRNFGSSSCKESSISMNLHTATHVDAPGHFLPGGSSVPDISVERYAGLVSVVQYSGNSHIDVKFLEAHLGQLSVGKVLFKTRNSENHRMFDEAFIALQPQAAEYLVELGVDLVGVDGPSVEIYGSKDKGSHKALLKANVVIVEGLDLSKVSAGEYEIFAFPLKIANSEGAPVRAVLRQAIGAKTLL